MKNSKRTSRRNLLRMGAAAMGGGLLCARKVVAAETPGSLGTPLGPYGDRSPYEKAVRFTRQSKTPETGSSFTPLADSVGTLTPSSLHYERHHAGIPNIDPAQHRLVVHGMVDRPLSLSVADIRRLPSVTRIMVLECGGNSGSEWAATTGPDVQRSFGLASCSEWTGVSLALLLKEVGVRPGASWLIAEGADACRMERSVPLAKAMDDALIAWGQKRRGSSTCSRLSAAAAASGLGRQYQREVAA
jgi:sulfane dehydrogenase subunit SoxC